jgi:aspartyl-tRNA(Asn)/glutamyl-tRNA(Gln) amidotransferase subunit C
MPSPLTLEDVERIAALAHLELTADEKQLFARQLAQILGFAERLQEVETTNVSADWRPVSETAELRSDERRESLSNDAALDNAPAAGPGGLFRVPRVIG